MSFDILKARDVHMELLYDRHDSLYSSVAQLTEKITEKTEGSESLLEATFNSRPTSDSTAFDLMMHRYYGLRLQTLLGITNPNGIFRTTVPYDPELQKRLVNEGEWFVRVSEDEKTMEISTLPF